MRYKMSGLGAERVKYAGVVGEMSDFLLTEQLYDRELWEIFVNQFRVRNDGDSGDVVGCWRGEFFGKMARGACLTYEYTRDEKLYEIITEFMQKMLETQDELGRFSTYSLETEFTGWDTWGRKYVMLAFEYYYDICRDERLKERILAALCRHADYIVANVGEGKKHPIAQSACFWHHAGLPSCSILEPMMKLYELTGKRDYLDFAAEIIKIGFTNNDDDLVEIFYAKKKKIVELEAKKAYEMMSCFQGLAEYYEVTGEEKYFVALKNFVDAVIDEELTIIGGLGTEHEFFDASADNQTLYKETPMIETCVTVTFMNLCYKMLQLTGESRFADCIERSAHNALRGAMNFERNKTIYQQGKPIETHYFIPIDSYSPLVRKQRNTGFGGCMTLREDGMKYGCCTCISSAGTALGALYGIMKEDGGYAINGYDEFAATLFDKDGKPFTLSASGSPFVFDEPITLAFSADEPVNVKLKLRIPSWSEGAVVTVKGCRITAEPGYLEVNETFASGDVIAMEVDARVHAVCRGGKVALEKCGFVLARDERYHDGFDEDVKPIAEGGAVAAKKVTTGKFNALVEYEIPIEGGKTITVCDYSSAGKSWDCGVDLRVTVWM